MATSDEKVQSPLTPLEQLKDTSAMLAVLLEDIYGLVSEEVKERICIEIGKINQCIRHAESQ